MKRATAELREQQANLQPLQDELEAALDATDAVDHELAIAAAGLRTKTEMDDLELTMSKRNVRLKEFHDNCPDEAQEFHAPFVAFQE